MTALLIAVQFIFGFVPGIELVTVFLLCFCYTFGPVCGMLTATAFSLLRCMIYGFMPNVIILYLVYYNLFALLFGFVGRRTLPVWLCPLLLCFLALASAFFALFGVKVSVLLVRKLSILLWILFGLACALLVIFFITLIKNYKAKEVASVTALAAFCTVTFTLLDDIITPLMLGYGMDASLAYFYTGFLTMVPQTICVCVSVFILFLPLKKLFNSVKKFREKENTDQ